MKTDFKEGDKVVHIITKKELTIVNNKGFYSNNALYLPCADSENVIDDYNSNFLKLVIPIKSSTREKALAWWNNLEAYKCDNLAFPRDKITLTGREIEMIWRKENPITTLLNELINTDFDGIEEEHSISDENMKMLTDEAKLEMMENWEKEPHYNDEDLSDSQIEFLIKSNQKQFKQFDESLFKAYINKFTNNDLIEMYNILERTIDWDNT